MRHKTFIFLFIFALIKASIFSLYGFGLVDQGESLHNALRILAGDLPYTDFFAIFPPLDNYFYALIFYLFGESTLVPRLISSFIFAFTPPLIFLILRRSLPFVYAIIPSFLVVFLDLNVERLFFFTPVLLGVYLFLRGIDSKDKRRLFYSGLFLGLAGLMRVDIPGTYLLGCVVALIAYVKLGYLKKQKIIFKYFIYLILGFLMTFGVSLIWMAYKGLLFSFYSNSVIKSIEITKLHSLPFPRFVNLVPDTLSASALSESYQVLLGYSILISYVGIAILLIRNRDLVRKNLEILVFLFSGVFALPYIFGRSDLGHLVKGGFPFLILGTVLLYKVVKSKRGVLKFVFFAIIILFFVANFVQSLWWVRFNDRNTTINGNILRLNSRYLTGSTIPSESTISKTTEFLRLNSKKNEPVLVIPYMAGLYYLSDRPAPTKFNNLLAGFITTEDGEMEFIENVEKANVYVVVYDPENGPKMKTSQMKDYNPLIHEYVMNNFEIVEKTEEGWLLMIKRNEKNS